MICQTTRPSPPFYDAYQGPAGRAEQSCRMKAAAYGGFLAVGFRMRVSEMGVVGSTGRKRLLRPPTQDLPLSAGTGCWVVPRGAIKSGCDSPLGYAGSTMRRTSSSTSATEDIGFNLMCRSLAQDWRARVRHLKHSLPHRNR